MPVILDLPVSAVSAQEVYRTEKQKVVLSQISPTGYMCSIPVTCVDRKIDFTDIPSGSTIEVVLKPNQKPVTFKVKDGVKVSVIDPLREHTKIGIKTESGNLFRVRDHAYLSTENYKNINGEYEFNDPNFHEPEIKTIFKIEDEIFERTMPAPPSREIYCRHLAAVALQMRKQHPMNSWATSHEVFFHKDALPKVFNNIPMYENILVDVNAATQFTYLTHKKNFGPMLHAMCQNLLKHLGTNEILEAKFYVVLNGQDATVSGHSCALILKCESDKDNNKTFKIKVYDPNLTYNHMTFATQDVANIKKLTFEDMFDLHEGYQDFDNMIFFELNHDWSEGVPQLQSTWNESGIVHNYEYSEQSDKFEVLEVSYLKKNIEFWGFKKVAEET